MGIMRPEEIKMLKIEIKQMINKYGSVYSNGFMTYEKQRIALLRSKMEEEGYSEIEILKEINRIEPMFDIGGTYGETPAHVRKRHERGRKMLIFFGVFLLFVLVFYIFASLYIAVAL